MNAQCFEDREGLTNLTGWFAVFEIADKAHTSAGGQGELSLRQAKGLALFTNQLAEFCRS